MLEGVFLAISPAPVEFVHPATIRATDRRNIEQKTEKPNTVDLGKAYDCAFEGLLLPMIYGFCISKIL